MFEVFSESTIGLRVQGTQNPDAVTELPIALHIRHLNVFGGFQMKNGSCCLKIDLEFMVWGLGFRFGHAIYQRAYILEATTCCRSSRKSQ